MSDGPILILFETDGTIVSIDDAPVAEAITADWGEGLDSLVWWDRNVTVDDYYVESDIVYPKTEFPTLQASTAPYGLFRRITFTDIPVGTTVIWPDGQSTFEEDGVLICELSFGGEYYFTFIHPKYYSKETNVAA